MENKELNQLIKSAFQEDAPRGDITSKYFGSTKHNATAKIIAKQTGILAGLDIAIACFKYIDKNLNIKKKTADKALLAKGDILAVIEGSLNSILLAERTALNFLQLMSGIATATAQMAEQIKGTKAKLLDTRKTIPGLRKLSKYAVICGGGINHRLDLSTMVLIKENHLKKLSLTELTKRLVKFRRGEKSIKVEIEAEKLEQVRDFLRLPVDIIMLDNMSVSEMKEAVQLRNTFNPNIMLEASGNIKLKNIRKTAQTGVDFISCGSITHSAKAFDFSLLIA